MNACMIPHTVPNRPTYGETEPTEARNDRLRLDRVELALEARAHRAARAVEQGAGVVTRRLAQLEELAHAARRRCAPSAPCQLGVLRGVGVQVGEVAAGPELALELVVRGAYPPGRRACRRSPSSWRATDSSPAITSCTTKLACSTRVKIERSWFIGAVLRRMSCGDAAQASKVSASTQPMRIVPSASSSSPRQRPAARSSGCAAGSWTRDGDLEASSSRAGRR